ncbi:glucose dehydrogenase [Trichonephila clavipes]|nr:glucose dehydrogenase [Trichonephila clavipes]
MANDRCHLALCHDEFRGPCDLAFADQVTMYDFVLPPFPYDIQRESSYPTPYVSTHLLPLILLSMMTQKHTPVTTKVIRNSYDYVIVGAGAAGSVVASRLSEKECVSVLLLEAGKPPPKVSDIPAAARSFVGTDIDWKYSTAPQEHTGRGLINNIRRWGVQNALLQSSCQREHGHNTINTSTFSGDSKIEPEMAVQPSTTG